VTTVAHTNMKAICAGFEGIFPSAVFAGIVGDSRHRALKRGTYHLSRQDNPAGTYSVIRPDDRSGAGPDNLAAAFDVSMSRCDMILATQRLMAAWSNNNDPRRKYLNAFNGWLGAGDAQRFDMVTRRVTPASPDHKWHVHGEVRRIYVPSTAMVKAVLSMLHGESITAYMHSIGVQPATPAAKPLAPPYPGHVLSRSNKFDPAVKTWQARMLSRGWKTIGTADGLFGPRTNSAVCRLQALCRVIVDGRIGPVTWPLAWTRATG
jgi:hypothetical protein